MQSVGFVDQPGSGESPFAHAIGHADPETAVAGAAATPGRHVEINTSRARLYGRLLVVLLLLLTWVGLLANRGAGQTALIIGLVASAPFTVLFGLPILFPYRLSLDVEGFLLSGFLVRTKRKVAWRDIEPFFVINYGLGEKLIAYHYIDPAHDLRGLSEPHAHQRSILTLGWPKSPARMVDDLNLYRADALRLGASSGDTTASGGGPLRTPASL